MRVRLTLGATPGLAGVAALALLLAIWGLAPDTVRAPVRERSLDQLLPWLAARGAAPPGVLDPVIVDIDRASLARIGAWPWPRARLAQLVAAVAQAKPAALGIDILIAGTDRLSPAALARALGAATGRADILALAPTLVDADLELGDALASVPAALGFALDPDGPGTALPGTPLLQRGSVALPDIWRAVGVIGPPPAVAVGAQGFGTLALATDSDGLIRRAPLLVFAAAAIRPGLAVETLRLAQEAGALVLGPGATLGMGVISTPLDADATLRLVSRPPAAWTPRTLSAAALLDDPGLGARLAGRIVLIGGSAPELGGLRATPASPATPSVQIQAEAIDSLLRGGALHRPEWLTPLEVNGAAALGLIGLLIAGRLRPLAAAAAMLAVCMAWCVGAAMTVRGTGLLADIAGPPLVAAGAFAVGALARFAYQEWSARLLRLSFEQHLAPDVVRRIAADPAALRLEGELREITALFTDIENFTGMSERADPADLVALLNAYFDMAGRIVTDHGGMIVKIVGDAAHAIFNAPFALEGHPRRAMDCALALLAASEAVRRTPLGCKLRLGRTRIGIETGMAVVGDIGGARKLDYTAHGNVMSTAARLEAANKELGSSICIGPGAAAQLDPGALRSVGTLLLRGQTRPIEVFTPAALP